MNLQKEDAVFVQISIVQINCECRSVVRAYMKQKAISICLCQSLQNGEICTIAVPLLSSSFPFLLISKVVLN